MKLVWALEANIPAMQRKEAAAEFEEQYTKLIFLKPLR